LHCVKTPCRPRHCYTRFHQNHIASSLSSFHGRAVAERQSTAGVCPQCHRKKGLLTGRRNWESGGEAAPAWRRSDFLHRHNKSPAPWRPPPKSDWPADHCPATTTPSELGAIYVAGRVARATHDAYSIMCRAIGIRPTNDFNSRISLSASTRSKYVSGVTRMGSTIWNFSSQLGYSMKILIGSGPNVLRAADRYLPAQWRSTLPARRKALPGGSLTTSGDLSFLHAIRR